MPKKLSPALRAAIAIINSTVNPAQRHDAINVTAPALAAIIERETSVSELLQATKTIVEKADGIISAIDGTTGQFEPEVAALTRATTAAEKVINKIKEAEHGKGR